MRQVYGTKVKRLTLGGLLTCLELPASRGVGMGKEKSAEAIGAGLTNGKGPNTMDRTGAWDFDDASKCRSPGRETGGHAGG